MRLKRSRRRGHGAICDSPGRALSARNPCLPPREIVRRVVQNVFGPLVQALAGEFGSQRGLAVHVRSDAEHYLAGERPLGRLADLRASLDVVVNRLVERFAQAGNSVRVESHAVANPGDSGGRAITYRINVNVPNIYCYLIINQVYSLTKPAILIHVRQLHTGVSKDEPRPLGNVGTEGRRRCRAGRRRPLLA